jgi:hypothetical protein
MMKTNAAAGRAGSRPTPPTAVAQRASLEAVRPAADHEKSKRHLTDKTVAQAVVLSRRAYASVVTVGSHSIGKFTELAMKQ